MTSNSTNKILVDTSIWVEYFKENSEIVETIDYELNNCNVYITGQIISELLQGVKIVKEFNLLSDHIDAIPYLDCNTNDWKMAGQISFQLRRTGKTILSSDVVIAAIAIRNNALIFTQDEHFKNIPDVKTYPRET
jgi:Predicted nucleic acid-binding protein, contains PIN domain